MAGQDKMPVVRKSDEIYHIEDFECGSVVLSVTYLHHGQNTKGHSHENVEAYYVAQGQGEMELGSIRDGIDGWGLCVHQSWCVSQSREQREQTLVLVCCWEKQK